MAYFLHMGGGGGQNYFQNGAPLLATSPSNSPTVSQNYHCCTNKYRTGKMVLAIIFRLQVQIPNLSELFIFYRYSFSPGNRIN